MIWFGMAVGSPLFGRLSDLSKRRKPYLCLCSIMGIVGSLFVFYVPISNIYYIAVLLFLVGLGGSGQNISFAVMAEHVPKNLQATALAMNNTVMMGVAAIVPTFVTSLIHYFEVDGHLTSAAFEKGFAVIPLFFILSLLISLFGIKETFCKEQGSVHRINQL
jgi:MFS family permease